MPDLGWIAQLLGAFATAHFASTVFSGRGRDPAQLGAATAGVLLAALVGAGWVVHPAAGMLLAFMIGWLDGGTRRWEKHLPLIGVALFSALLLMTFGAGWLKFPLVIVLLITGFSWLSQQGKTQEQEEGQESVPAALPPQTTAQPVRPIPQPEPIPVQATPTPAAQVMAPTVTALHHESRLPAEARALLVAIDYRTQEALQTLTRLGQTGTQAAYQARAIRDDYAPAAVRAYLNLPPTRADTVPLEGDRTGKDLLIEQLNLLLSAAQDVLDSAARSGGQELLTNARFLREKFGEKEDDLKV